MTKSNGEHILDIAAMKFFDNENWDIELAAMLPTGFKEVLIREIDNRLMDLSVSVSGNVTRNMDKKMEKMRTALTQASAYLCACPDAPNIYKTVREALTDAQG